MQALTKAQLAAALVATFGFAMHGSAMAAPGNSMGATEKQSPMLIAEESGDKSAEKSKEASCKGKEKSCKGKEGSCKGKEGSCKGKEGSCKGKEGSCKGKESK